MEHEGTEEACFEFTFGVAEDQQVSSLASTRCFFEEDRSRVLETL